MTINVNGITLNYTKEGVGKPLIMLHGNGESLSVFKALIKKLKEQYTIYAIDSRGHGLSTKGVEISYPAMVEDIYSFILKMNLKEVSVVGFSDGAIIGLMLEMAHPDTFKRMALLGLNLKPSDFKDESLEYVKQQYEETKDPLMRLMLNEPNIELEALKSVNPQTLIVRAEDDIFQESLYENIVKTMPNAKLKVIEGHDHGSYIIDNDLLADDFVRFFK